VDRFTEFDKEIPVNTPKPGHPAEDFPTRATRALTEAAELHGKPEHVLQPVMARAAHLVMAVISGGGDGQHEIHFSLSHPDGDLEYTLPYSAASRIIAFPDDGGEQMLVMLLSIASLAEHPGIMTLRSRLHTAGVGPGELTIRGWHLGGHSPQPMTDSELFAVTSTSRGGAPAVPEPGTRLRAAFHLDHGPHPTRP
jgi:hypothetical protein